jgi:hypothetical protein
MIHQMNRKTREHGVSESLGFLLIFTMVIVGIGLVTLYGYPMLLQQQTSADEQIMEKNMIVLQNDVKSLSYKTVPFKETSLRVGGGALTLSNSLSTPASMNITDCTVMGTPYVAAFQSGDLRYSSINAGTDISIQNGAVVKRQDIQPGSVMLAKPRWFYDSQTNTMVINLIGFNSTSGMSRTGISTVQMTMNATNYSAIPITLGTSLCVEYTPDPANDYSTAWENYFMNTINPNQHTPDVVFGTGKRYHLPIDTTRDAMLVIKKYDVTIQSI